jgi:hypothetical protein
LLDQIRSRCLRLPGLPFLARLRQTKAQLRQLNRYLPLEAAPIRSLLALNGYALEWLAAAAAVLVAELVLAEVMEVLAEQVHLAVLF